MHLKMSSAKSQPFCLGLNALNRTATGCNILRPEQNGQNFVDDILKCILINKGI